jgi:hypothetical protein
MINLVSTLKHSGDRVCAKCRITCYKMRKAVDLYVSPGTDVSELEKFKEEEHDSSHQAEGVSAPSVAIEVVNISLQAVGESPVKKWMQGKKYSEEKA